MILEEHKQWRDKRGAFLGKGLKHHEVSDWTRRLVEALWCTPLQVEHGWEIVEDFRKELIKEYDRTPVSQADGASGEAFESEGGSGYIAGELSNVNVEPRWHSWARGQCNDKTCGCYTSIRRGD